MATIGSGSPLLYCEVSATQTGGSGNSRTVKITAKFRVNGNTSSTYASYYGYPCNWRASVNGVKGSWAAMKGNESWKSSDGLRTFEQTLTVDVGTSASKTISVGIDTNHPSYSSWNGSHTFNFTVGQTNTAPYWPSGSAIRARNGSTASSPVMSGYIPETTNTVYIEWDAAKDNEGGTLNYSLNVSVNGGAWTQVDYGSDRAHSYNIGSGNEGQTLRWYVDVKDTAGAWSPKIYTGTVTKNTLTAGSFTSHSRNIDYQDGNQTFKLTFTGGKNTDGTAPKYLVYSDTVTIYNQREVTAGEETITVYRTGTVPTTPYIKWTDLVNTYKNSNFNGPLHVGLRTGNGRGTYKYSNGSIGVDIRTNPTAPTSVTISGGTAWKSTSRGSYYVPTSGADGVNITWAGGGDKLGQGWKYKLYKIINGVETHIKDVANTVKSYTLNVPIPSGAKSTVAFQVRVETDFGYTSGTKSSTHDLHWYSAPSFSFGTPARTATEANVKYSDNINTSIPGAATTISWASSGGTRTVDTSAKNVKLTGLAENSSYTITATLNDNTGLSSNRGITITVGANQAIFFINKYGVGVGPGAKATSTYPLYVNGGLYANGTFSMAGGTFRKAVTCEDTINAANLTVGGNNVYHVGRKPSKSDVGLGSVNNWGASSSISANSTTTYATTNMVAQVRAEKFNKDIQDTRTTNFTPLSNGGEFKITFQNKNTNEFTGLGYNFYTLVHIPRWVGGSGGRPSQLAFADNGTIWHRQGISDTGWDGWKRISSHEGGLNSVANNGQIEKLTGAGTYMEVNRGSLSTKGITWWDSDLKFKENVVSLDSSILKNSRTMSNSTPALDLINKIEHYSFDYNTSDDNRHIDCGYVAQQLEEVDSRLIFKVKQPEESEYWSEEDEYTRHPNETVIIPYLSKSIQELSNENINLKEKVINLEKKINEVLLKLDEVPTLQL